MKNKIALKKTILFVIILFAVQAKTEIKFYIPPCYPNCSGADVENMLLSGERENEIIQTINSAQKSIYFSMYTFSRQPIFEALVRAVVERGVELKGIIDHDQLININPYCISFENCQFEGLFNSKQYLEADISQRYQMAANSKQFQEATKAERIIFLFYKTNYNVVIKSAPGRSRIVHNKFVLIDEEYLLAGSGNWSYTAMSVNLENIEFANFNENPYLINAFRCAFNLIWSGDGVKISQMLSACEVPSYVYFTPAPPNRMGIYQQILESIEKAEHSIKISMHHLVHEDVILMLRKAAERGVKVNIVLDDDDCRENSFMRQMLSQYLTHKNVEIRFSPTNRLIFQLSHNKYGLFDNKYAINGAGNWSLAGLHSNYEFFILYYQPHEVQKFIQNFELIWGVAKMCSQLQVNFVMELDKMR